jgi:hypothetical protein
MIVSLLLERDISKTLISIYVQVLLEMTKHLTLDRTAWGCRSATEKQLAEDTAHHQKPSTDGGAAHRALILKASTDCTSTATGEESRVCSLHWRSSPCTNQLRSLTGVAALVGAWISRGYSRGSRPAAERWTNAHLGRSGLHLHSHSKSQQNTPRKFRSYDFSHETLEDLTFGGREENESGRAVRRQGGCQPLFNRLFYIPLNAPGYIRAKSISPRA